MPLKPTKKEEEYFAKLEMEKKKKKEEEKEKAKREELKKLHYMHCPKCGMQLKDSLLNGVLIDRCDDCGGIWLDKGELDKLRKSSEKNFFEGLFSYFKK